MQFLKDGDKTIVFRLDLLIIMYVVTCLHFTIFS